jgi:hypothetical protein
MSGKTEAARRIREDGGRSPLARALAECKGGERNSAAQEKPDAEG